MGAARCARAVFAAYDPELDAGRAKAEPIPHARRALELFRFMGAGAEERVCAIEAAPLK